MRRGIRFAAAVALAALIAAPSAFGSTRETTLELRVLDRINATRHDHGLPPLSVSERLTAAAVQHTREMGADGYFAHDSFDRSPFSTRLRRWYPPSGRGSWTVGENLLWSSPDVDAA